MFACISLHTTIRNWTSTLRPLLISCCQWLYSVHAIVCVFIMLLIIFLRIIHLNYSLCLFTKPNMKPRLLTIAHVYKFEAKSHLNIFKHVVHNARNTTHRHHVDQLVNAVEGNNRCLFWDSYETCKYFCGQNNTLWDFKFSRRRVWSSDLSSGMYCRVK
jgi:hypothetical protein